jgi:hypothetical protein
MSIELASDAEHHPGYGMPPKHCAAGRDGDCSHPECPQNRDNEPHATGRSCPIWLAEEES